MAANRQHDNTQSAMLTKLSPELRKAIDAAVIERFPPTYQAVWMSFKLGEMGVSYWSFYRYARRLRDRANVAELAALADEDAESLDEPIRKLVSRRLLDLLLTTDDLATMKEASSLLAAHRHAQRTLLTERRRVDETHIAWARLEHDRDELRIKAEHLVAVRRRFEFRDPRGQQSSALIREEQSSALMVDNQDGASSDNTESRQNTLKLPETRDNHDLDDRPAK